MVELAYMACSGGTERPCTRQALMRATRTRVGARSAVNAMPRYANAGAISVPFRNNSELN
jgi:hypothetical protein